MRLDDRVYERIAVRKRDDETFSEAIERLLADPPLASLAGVLDEEEAAEIEAVIEAEDAAYEAVLDERLSEIVDSTE